jgi:hypothetical protein
MRGGSIRTLNGSIALLLLTALVIVLVASASSAQVVDHSSRGGDLSSRISQAAQQAASGDAGTPFYIMFRFNGLIPSDAEAGGSGSVMIRRYDGWTMTSSSGLLPIGDPWDPMSAGEQLLDLSTMRMLAPPAASVLAERPMLAFMRGVVRGSGGTVLDDLSLRLPEGMIRLRDRSAYWLGDADGDQVMAWMRSARELPADGATSGFQEDLVGLLSVQPAGTQVVAMLEEIATGHEDEGIRHRAIGYLGRRPEDTSRSLNRILDTAEQVDDRVEALGALAGRLGPASKDRLIQAARDTGENESVRVSAVSYLSRIDGNDVDSVLERLLSDPAPDIREHVVSAWERREPARAVPLLERAVANDEEEDVREQAVQSLGDIGHPQATAALERILRENQTEVLRRLAMRELVGRKTDEKVAWLASLAANDPSIEIRKEAIRQLGRLTDDPEARRALERLLKIGR